MIVGRVGTLVVALLGRDNGGSGGSWDVGGGGSLDALPFDDWLVSLSARKSSESSAGNSC